MLSSKDFIYVDESAKISIGLVLIDHLNAARLVKLLTDCGSLFHILITLSVKKILPITAFVNLCGWPQQLQ